RSVLERYQELAARSRRRGGSFFFALGISVPQIACCGWCALLSNRLLQNASNQKTKETRNENLTNVPTCFGRNSHHQFGAPGAQVSASRPDATSRLSPSRVYARHRCHRFCECRRGSRRGSRSRAWRYLCEGFRSEECLTPSIPIRRKWNLRDAGGCLS